MSSSRFIGPGTILGGLPIIAEVSWGYDGFFCEDWSSVETIYWRKRDGSAGKPVSQALLDRAERYDPYFATLIEQLTEQAAAQAAEARGEEYPPLNELVPFSD